MLRQRLLTALVLIPLVIGAILWLPTTVVGLLFAGILLLGGAELASLCGLTAGRARGGYLLFLLALLLGAATLPPLGLTPLVLGVAALWWLALIPALSLPAGRRMLQGLPTAVLAGLGALLLAAAWLALVTLHGSGARGPLLLLVLLVLIWGADSLAYFSGKRWGRRKLAPAISPGKTWEGLLGALAGIGVYALALQAHPWFASTPTFGLLCFFWLVVGVSVIGDLWESLLKRRCGVKDSGQLLPGHGGVLDRIDSLLAALPVFVVGGLWLELST